MATPTTADRLGELDRFVLDHGRMPGRSRLSAVPGEQALYLWVSRAHGDSLGARLRALALDARYPDWRTSRADQTFAVRAEELAGFIEGHGRLPSSAEEAERYLRRWWTDAHHARSGAASGSRPWNEMRAATLNSLMAMVGDEPRACVRLTRTERAALARRLERTEALCREHGRFPGAGRNAGSRERTLRQWIQEAGGDSPRALRDAIALDARLPGWRVSPGERAFLASAAEVADFAQAHGRFPRAYDGDPDERRLGDWLSSAGGGREGYGNVRWDERREAVWGLLQDLKRSLGPSAEELHAEHFARRTADVAEFYRTHGRLPLSGSDTAHERSLYLWFLRACAARSRWTPERERVFAEILGDTPVRAARDARFEARVGQVARFVREHGRLPGERTGSLYNFVSTNRRELRSGRLSPWRRAMLDEQVPGWCPGHAGTATS